MKQYLDLMAKILVKGVDRADRTGTGTRALFGEQMRFNLNDGFPAVTTKKLAWWATVSELLWFIEGSGDERRLCEILHGTTDPSKKTIWTDNANADYWIPKAKFKGDLGRVYGVNWRQWTNSKGQVTDQLMNLVKGLKTDPYGRRHILSAWNPGELDQMALPPCHIMAQFFVANNKLSCQMNQRSADVFLGVPFNIASYSLLTHMIAQVCGLEVDEFIWIGGDCHLYLNHIDQAKEQLARQPFDLPTLMINKSVMDITGFKMNDFELINYKHHEAIKAPMAV